MTTSPTPSQPMTTHTPTPWIVEEGTHWLSICEPTAPVEHGQRQAIVATRWSGQVTPKERANAAFIIDACNSHASLKARIAELEGALRKISEIKPVEGKASKNRGAMIHMQSIALAVQSKGAE